MTIKQWLVDVPGLLGLLNVVIAVTLASTLGLIVARAGKSAVLRHAILLASLILVLASPLVIGVSRAGRLGWLTVTLNDAPSRQVSRTDDTRVDAVSHVAGEESVPLSKERHRNRVGDKGALQVTKQASGDRATIMKTSSSVSEADHLQPFPNVDAPTRSRNVAPLFPWWQLLGTLAAVAWFLGSVVAATRLARGYLVVLRLRRSLRAATAEVQRLAQNAAGQVGLTATPRVFESVAAPMPLIVGLWRPIVVVPCGIADQAGAQQLEGMLLHEMGHIARRDQWIGLLQRVVAVLFWWQPLVSRQNSRLSAVREELCDNYVIRQQGSGYVYAQALVELAAHVALRGPMPATIGLLEENDGLERRVTRLLNTCRSDHTRLSRTATVAVGAFGTLLATLLVATTIRVVDASQDETNTEATANANEIRVCNGDELLRAGRTARPGTTILLEPGTYRGGMTLNKLHGRADHPIVIVAADPDNPPIIKGGNSCLHLTDPVHVQLRNLVLTGAHVNGLNIDDGGSYDTPAHHVVVHGLTVRDIGSDRNHDGIKLSGLDDFRVESCTVERWGKKGSGIDMVGCHRGVVAGSTFRDGDKIFGNAVQMKGGSRDIVVSDCRFENAGGRAINIGGSTGAAYFRPKSPGYEAKDITVEDCTFIGSMAPVAFVGVDGAVVRHNTIYRPTRWVLRILQENQGPRFVPCREGEFTNNLIVFRSDELALAANIGPNTEPKSFQFSDNIWYCEDRPQQTRRSIHLPAAESNGTYGHDPKLIDPEHGNLRLRQGSPVHHAGVRSRHKNRAASHRQTADPKDLKERNESR